MLAAIKHSQISQIFTPFDWLTFYQELPVGLENSETDGPHPQPLISSTTFDGAREALA